MEDIATEVTARMYVIGAKPLVVTRGEKMSELEVLEEMSGSPLELATKLAEFPYIILLIRA